MVKYIPKLITWWKIASKIPNSYYNMNYNIVAEVIYISYAFLNLINTTTLGNHKNISESLILVRFQYILCNCPFSLSWIKTYFCLENAVSLFIKIDLLL